MSDISTQPPPPPADDAAEPAAPAQTLTSADVAAIATQLAALQAPTPAPADAAAAAAAAPAPATSPTNLFEKGNMVTFSWADPYDGPTTRYGIVVDTLPDEGAGARSIVAWFDAVSGPIGDHLLAAG